MSSSSQSAHAHASTSGGGNKSADSAVLFPPPEVEAEAFDD